MFDSEFSVFESAALESDKARRLFRRADGLLVALSQLDGLPSAEYRKARESASAAASALATVRAEAGAATIIAAAALLTEAAAARAASEGLPASVVARCRACL
jgi:hypothetical protein